MLYRQEEKHMKRTNFSLTERQMERLRIAFSRKRDFPAARAGRDGPEMPFWHGMTQPLPPLPSRPRRNAPFIPMSLAQGLSGAAFGKISTRITSSAGLRNPSMIVPRRALNVFLHVRQR